MKAYSIFDDYPLEAIQILREAGIDVTLHASGIPRPNEFQMEEIMQIYDCIIIGTSQKISEKMFERINSERIIATASVGTDHIRVPEAKKQFVKIISTPGANSSSVAEYIIGAMLLSRKRFFEGTKLYSQGYDNRRLIKKPEDICGTVIGFVGAGRITTRVIELLQPFGVQILCYTKNPDHHKNLNEKYDLRFVSLREIANSSDIISVNVPETVDTRNLIDAEIIREMKRDCIFISVSRASVVDISSLAEKVKMCPNFYAVLDLDLNADYSKLTNERNMIITPHIAGGTIESRKRMFIEIAKRISSLYSAK